MTGINKNFFAGPFFRASYFNDTDINETISRIKRKIPDSIVNLLKEQNNSSDPGVVESISKIESGNALTVITGQQLGYLGGPLLTLYKILTTIKVAKEFEQKYKIEVVPIFWMQSEDHDFKEISKAVFVDSSAKLSEIQLSDSLHNENSSVGKLRFNSDAATQLKSFFSEHSDLTYLVDQVLDAYSENKTLSEATLSLFRNIFSKYGLLLFDPDHPSVKSTASELIEKSFKDADRIEELLTQRTMFLKKHSLPEQVKIKPGSPLFFLSFEGKRERLNKLEDSCWESSHAKISKAEIENILKSEPERFSTSALIRPLLQDYIFPNLAYVGGIGEAYYWAQTLPVYEFFGVTQSLFIPRAQFLLLEPKQSRIMEKIAAEIKDLEKTGQEFCLNKISNSDNSSDKLFYKLNNEIKESFSTVSEALNAVNPGLQKFIDKTTNSIEGNIAKLKGRYEKALLEKEEVLVNQFDSLKSYTNPDGIPQDRIVSFIGYIMRYGEEFTDQLLGKIEVKEDFSYTAFHLDK